MDNMILHRVDGKGGPLERLSFWAQLTDFQENPTVLCFPRSTKMRVFIKKSRINKRQAGCSGTLRNKG
jgi:hypothetical protein